MKKILILMSVAIIALTSCKSAPKADEAKTADQKIVNVAEGTAYILDGGAVVSFIGTKPIGQHHGNFKITEGAIYVKNGAMVSGGKITLDMKSLKIIDKDTNGVAKLTKHLSSPDFFEVDKFPTAIFEITSVEPYTDSAKTDIILNGATHVINGNLTLKGATKNISFPAIIKVNNQVMSAAANFNINRTNWGLVYGNDKSLGDKFIRPEVNISFSISANKAQ